MPGQLAQRAGQVFVGQHLHRLLDHAHVVLGQRARVGTGVGQHLVLFVQRLRQAQRGLGAETEARVGLALQRGQVVQQRAGLGAGLGFFGHRGGLGAAGLGDGVGLGGGPYPVGAALGVVVLLEGGVEPLALVLAGLGRELGLDFPVVAGHVLADLFFALDHDGQRGRLHPAHGGQEEAAVAAVEGGHRPRAVDAHQPVGLGAAACGVGQALHLLVAAQALEAVADGLRRHALQPEPAHRLVQLALAAIGVLHDQAEDQLTLAARVAGVDEFGDVLALDQLDHRRQPRLGLVDRRQVEVRRHHRQVGEAPLAALDVVFVRRLDFHQVADGRGDDVGVVLEVVGLLVELARDRGQRPHDVLGHARLFRNDQ